MPVCACMIIDTMIADGGIPNHIIEYRVIELLVKCKKRSKCQMDRFLKRKSQFDTLWIEENKVFFVAFINSLLAICVIYISIYYVYIDK